VINARIMNGLAADFRDELAMLWRSTSLRMVVDLHIRDAADRLMQLRVTDFENASNFVSEHSRIATEYDFWFRLRESLTQYTNSTNLDTTEI
jgi:hypothetical protein